MYQEKKIVAIIAAAGSGKRMGCDTPKQFLKINGDYILQKTVRAFEKNEFVDDIYVVTNDCVFAEGILCCKKLMGIIQGGKERQDSIWNVLNEIKNKEYDFILIHDGARPYVTQKIISEIIKESVLSDAAVCAVPMKDTIRKKEKTLDRSTLFSVQTPQCFEKNLLIEAYINAMKNDFYGTDDAMLVEQLNHKITIVRGDYGNIKITTKEDLPVETRVGIGYDVHRLVDERKLILGGVEVPHCKGLLGHSDADVLVHAVMDALLGAAGKGDIGKYFPDSDEKYKGISSLTLLKKVNEILLEEDYTIGNIDVTIIAQRPKIKDFIPEMLSAMADAMEIEKSKINIKGTTTEKLGFVGREEGIAAEAICILNR